MAETNQLVSDQIGEFSDPVWQAPKAPGMRVLQVEDDATTAKTVESMLRSEGHDCDTASLGEEAVCLAQEKDYDLILLDIMLPDIDGYEVLKRLRERDIYTPVIVQSGLVNNDRDGASLGSSECLIKPFSKQEFITRIESVRGASQSRMRACAADESQDDDQERRLAPRIKIAMSAEIVYCDANCIADALIVSLSEGGAAIQPAVMLDFPERFTLRIKCGPIYDCEVCWRHGDKLGVCFLDK